MSELASLSAVYQDILGITDIDATLLNRMSPPLLMAPQRRWFSSDKKILVVGQETLGWKQPDINIESFNDFVKTENSVNLLQEAYVKFCFAKKHKNRTSPFWRAYREIREAFEVSSSGGIDTNVLWTNLYKVSNNGRSWYGKNNRDDRKVVEKVLREVLSREISILKPTGIIFFTGPKYDRYLKESIQGQVTLSKLDDRYPARQLARLCIEDLPIHVCRTYHPNYLQRSGKWEWIGLIKKALTQGAQCWPQYQL